MWKLLIDERYQGRGYGAAVVRQIAELVRAEGAAELLTSYVPEDGGPAGLQSRAWDEAGYVQPTRAEFVAIRGEMTKVPAVTAFPNEHFNAITSWAIDRNGEVKHVYA